MDSRRLAAIMFADIVGYTAMMQQDEKKALSYLHGFKGELESKIPAQQGEIIQFYGDGCLAIFSSSVDAVSCAKDLQACFHNELKIPVRIGLHAGDIIFKDDNVFGDAVNIASRVESISVPGAVLLSSNVRDQIKNQPDFELVALGRFEFKNVADGMTVYALRGENLVVPKKEEIKGKLKTPIKSKPKKFWLWSVPLLLIAGLFGIYQWFQQVNTANFRPKILKERIAVLPFKNNTNNPELDILGDMAADWINKGLMDIGEAEVVSPNTVRANKESIGILENDSKGRPSFFQLTGAQNLITGNFYQEKDELLFKLKMEDALSGNLHFDFVPIRGKVQEKELLITQLREIISGYWVARELVDLEKITAPKYNAYKLYLLGINQQFEGESYRRAIAIDSNFYLAHIHFINENRIGILGDSQSHFDFLKRHYTKLSEYEKAWLHHLEGVYSGDGTLAFNSLNKIRKKYPYDFIVNHETASAAIDILQNPELCSSVYNELSIRGTSLDKMGQYYFFRIRNHVRSYIRLNQLEKATQLVNSVQSEKRYSSFPFMEAMIFEALANNNTEKIEFALSKINTPNTLSPYSYFALVFYLESSIFLHESFRNTLVEKAVSYYHKLPSENSNKLLWKNFIAYLENKPFDFQLNDLHSYPIPFQISGLSWAAQSYINTNAPQKASSLIEQLKSLTEETLSVSNVFGAAFAHYQIGKIYSLLNRQKEALVHLKMAKKMGAQIDLHQFQYDRALAPLYDIPEFQEILQPIWPEHND